MQVFIYDIRLRHYEIKDDRYKELMNEKYSDDELADICQEEGKLKDELITGYYDDPIKFYTDEDYTTIFVKKI